MQREPLGCGGQRRPAQASAAPVSSRPVPSSPGLEGVRARATTYAECKQDRAECALAPPGQCPNPRTTYWTLALHAGRVWIRAEYVSISPEPRAQSPEGRLGMVHACKPASVLLASCVLRLASCITLGSLGQHIDIDISIIDHSILQSSCTCFLPFRRGYILDPQDDGWYASDQISQRRAGQGARSCLCLRL